MEKWRISAMIFMIALMSVTVMSCKKDNTVSYKAGTYQGAGQGLHGPVEVEVTLTKNAIKEIKVTGHSETPGLSDPVMNQIPGQIIENQSLSVDNISGATYAFNGLMDAVSDALTKAGADVEALKSAAVSKSEAEDVSKEADVVIIGAGGAGLSAAVAAVETGVKVIVLEATPIIGGNTLRGEATYNTADAERQGPMGIEDSAENHYEQTMKGGYSINNPDLVKTMTSKALDGLHWLESYGLEFKPEVFTPIGGMWQRGHQVVVEEGIPGGTAFIGVLKKAVEAKGAEIITNARATKLIKENGRVVAVEADYNGGTLTVKAGKAVVITTGGFAANSELASKYDTRVKPGMKTSNAPSSTGDGIVLAEGAGAALVDMDKIQIHPLGDPTAGGVADFIGQWMGAEYYVFVNKEGKRFVSETEKRDVMANAEIAQEGSTMYLLVDSSGVTPEWMNNINDLIERGQSVKADTIAELAEKIGVNPENLQATIDEYNTVVETKNDPYGKTLFKTPFATPPYYASQRVPTMHYCMGGVKINTDAQVIDVDGNVIPGLYAAGEVTGGVHGGNRLGGNSFPDITVFGRIAGANAAQE